MWIKNSIWEEIPTLTKSGKQRNYKKIITYPSDIECWFHFAHIGDIEALKRMYYQGFNINSLSLSDENLGIISLHKKNIKLLAFFLEYGGNLHYDYISSSSYSFERLIDIASITNIPIKFFKLIFNKLINDNVIELDYYQKSFSILTKNDKNLSKIKYILKKIPKEYKYIFKASLLQSIGDMNVPKIKFFLSDKESLYQKLKKIKATTFTKNLVKI